MEDESEEKIGLTTETALKRLVFEIKKALGTDIWTIERWKDLIGKSLASTTEDSLFPWPNVCLTALYFFMLFAIGLSFQDPWLIFESVLMFVFLIINFLINLANLYLTEVEMRRRVQRVLKKLEGNLANGISWSQENYPHLHTPLSASVVLQWTIRDGCRVNLPWALLVQGDMIYLKPGQVAPGKCHSEEDPSIVVNKGTISRLFLTFCTSSKKSTPEFL